MHPLKLGILAPGLNTFTGILKTVMQYSMVPDTETWAVSAVNPCAQGGLKQKSFAGSPSMPRSDPHHIANHRTRFLACLATTLVVLTVAVRFWPVQVTSPDLRPAYREDERERIHIEEIQPTKQAASAPAPPAPMVPILVPDDEYLTEDEIDLTGSSLPLDISEAPATDPGEQVPSSAGITAGPRPIRFVVPEDTQESKRRRVRAKLVVQVLVNVRGQVEEATVTERFLLDEDGLVKEPVDVLGHGLEEAALSAATRYRYRPARKDGKAITSRTTITFTFGLDS